MSEERCPEDCCSAEALALPDGGWSNTDKGWVLHPLRQGHVDRINRAEMARIDKAQSHLPICVLCGQRSLKLDQFGLCSKVSAPHQQRRGLAPVAGGRRR